LIQITVNLTVMTLRGMNVYTQATNEKIGTISDALVDEQGFGI